MWTIELCKPIIFRQTHGLARPDTATVCSLHILDRGDIFDCSRMIDLIGKFLVMGHGSDFPTWSEVGTNCGGKP